MQKYLILFWLCFPTWLAAQPLAVWKVGCDPSVRHSDQELAFKIK
ncbi:MAG: hypothetical protein ACKVUS_08390 [Saprospiraceae bacterium]